MGNAKTRTSNITDDSPFNTPMAMTEEFSTDYKVAPMFTAIPLNKLRMQEQVFLAGGVNGYNQIPVEKDDNKVIPLQQYDINTAINFLPNVIDIFAAEYCTYFLCEDNNIFCLGQTRIPVVQLEGSSACSQLSFFKNHNFKVLDMHGGRDHAIFLVQEKQNSDLVAYTCGSNTYNQLCRQTVSETQQTVRVNPKSYNDEKLVQVSAGVYNSLLHTKNNSGQDHLWLAGHNYFNCEGMGANLTQVDTKRNLVHARVQKISHGYCFIVTLTTDGDAFGTGLNIQQQLGTQGHDNFKFDKITIPNNEKLKDVCAGYYHCFYLTNSGELYASGSSTYGCLGLDENNNRVMQKVDLLDKVRVSTISTGWYTTEITTECNRLLVFGNLGASLVTGSSSQTQGSQTLISDPRLRQLLHQKKTKIVVNTNSFWIFCSDALRTVTRAFPMLTTVRHREEYFDLSFT